MASGIAILQTIEIREIGGGFHRFRIELDGLLKISFGLRNTIRRLISTSAKLTDALGSFGRNAVTFAKAQAPGSILFADESGSEKLVCRDVVRFLPRMWFASSSAR